MLVALMHALDKRFGLTPEERRDFRLLYGDAWRMVKDLLDHASEETTRKIYLNPRELHLMGEKPQVASSRQEAEGLQRYYALTA